MSTRRAGSQNPIDIPGIRSGGVPLVQAQIGESGFLISRFFGLLPLPIEKPPMEIGNRHPQQTSVIGFTKFPLQVTLALAESGIIIAIISNIICLLKWFSWSLVVLLQDFILKTSLRWFCCICFCYPINFINKSMLLKITLFIISIFCVLLIMSGYIPQLAMLSGIRGFVFSILKVPFTILRALWPLLLLVGIGYFVCKKWR